MLQKLNYDPATSKYWMELTEEELELIGALTAMIRLGQTSVYSQAAGDIGDAITSIKGHDFNVDSIDAVGIGFTIEDESGNPVVAIMPGADITIEVGV